MSGKEPKSEATTKSLTDRPGVSGEQSRGANQVVTCASVATTTDDLGANEGDQWNLDNLLPGEDKNPFSGLSDEQLGQLEDVLSCEEVKNLLQTTDLESLEHSLMSNMATDGTGQPGQKADESLKLDIFGNQNVIDEASAHQLIRDSVREHELAVVAAAFNDHAYACTPKAPQPSTSKSSTKEQETDSGPAVIVETLPAAAVQHVDIGVGADFDSEADKTEEESAKEEESLKEDEEEEGKEGVKRGRRKKQDEASPAPSRRSCRISDNEQRVKAEQIRQENRRLEKEALEERQRQDIPPGDQEDSSHSTDSTSQHATVKQQPTPEEQAEPKAEDGEQDRNEEPVPEPHRENPAQRRRGRPQAPSGCLKNYCECYEAKIMCSSICKCVGCKNFEESPERKTLMHLADAAEVRVQQQTAAKTKLSSQMSGLPSKPPVSSASGERLPYTLITTEVAEATCACLLAQAEEAERMKMPPVVQERMVIEEFGRCLMQIIESANKTRAAQESLP